MIDKPVMGMRVTVDNSLHCFSEDDNNHSGGGRITEIDGDDSFRVKMDDYPEEKWWRCRGCVSEIMGQGGKLWWLTLHLWRKPLDGADDTTLYSEGLLVGPVVDNL